MAKKRVVLKSRRPEPKGRTMKPALFTLHPETYKRLKMTIAEGSTSAFVDHAIIVALNALEGADTFKLSTEDTPQE